MTDRARVAGLYGRVSTPDQVVENQMAPLRRFAEARGWTAIEYTDVGQSGAKERRPQLDRLMADVRARRVDLVAIVKLDRLARSVPHLVALSQELEALGVDLIVLDQSIDTTTPAGRLTFVILAAVAAFERDLIRDRVIAGLKRARAAGVIIGRPKTLIDLRRARIELAQGRSLRQTAKLLGCGASTLSARLAAAHQPPAAASA